MNAYRLGAKSIAAVCPHFTDVVTFKDGKRLNIPDREAFLNELGVKARMTMNSTEFGRMLSGGFYTWGEYICKNIGGTIERHTIQR